ncbi:Bifunctional dehydrogenase and ferrochelatase [Diatrype stigma]|uniref:precorrin-2 dehydrogenase n=1 Tax=Diatrype stigma TaxID=117547 RepID=A0AAN9UKL6_9PEZI
MADETKQFPKVQGGGSLILAWQIRNKHVLVVGGGEVAAGRILNVLNADAYVTVVCPESGLNPEVRYRIAQNEVAHIDRVFQPSDLESLPPPRKRSSDTTATSTATAPTATTDTETNTGTTPFNDAITTPITDATAAAIPTTDTTPKPPDMVLVAIDDPAASTQIWKLCKAHRIAANIADVPPECDFYFGSVHRDGPIQVMVSTNGQGPRLASRLRKRIAEVLQPAGEAGNAVERIGALRRRLRAEVAPGRDPADGAARMRWMGRVSDAYAWDEMAALTDEDLDNLLRFYAADQAPSFDQLVAMRGGNAPEDLFDGSFGFSVGV